MRVFSVEKHMDTVPEEFLVVSVVTFQHLETRAKVRDKKDDRLLLDPKRRQNGLTYCEEQKSSQGSGSKNRKTRETGVKFHAD